MDGPSKTPRSGTPAGEDADRAGISIRVLEDGDDPPPCDAEVLEEDTYRVLGTAPAGELRAEHPVRVWTALREFEPHAPGSVVVQETVPLRLLAIVHDLAASPTWTEAWIVGALERAFEEVERRELRTLLLHRIGTRHGSLSRERFTELLDEVLRRTSFRRLEHLYVAR